MKKHNLIAALACAVAFGALATSPACASDQVNVVSMVHGTYYQILYVEGAQTTALDQISFDGRGLATFIASDVFQSGIYTPSSPDTGPPHAYGGDLYDDLFFQGGSIVFAGGALVNDGDAYLLADGDGGHNPQIRVGVRAGTGVSAANQAGMYAGVIIGGGGNDGAPIQCYFGLFSQDNTGADLTLSLTENANGNVSAVPVPGADKTTYSSSGDGSFTTASGWTGAQTASGNLSVMHQTGIPGSSAFTFYTVKLGMKASVESLRDAYAFVAYNLSTDPTVFGGVGSATTRGIVMFDGAGNWSTSGAINNNNGSITDNGTNSGTYSVAANGVVTLSNGLTGAVSFDGKVFVLSQLQQGHNPGVVVGLKASGGDN